MTPDQRAGGTTGLFLRRETSQRGDFLSRSALVPGRSTCWLFGASNPCDVGVDYLLPLNDSAAGFNGER